MRHSVELWLRVAFSRAMIRVLATYGDPLWIVVNIGGPLLTSIALAFLYGFAGLPQLTGFAILGGGMVAYWGNVLWSMAAQLNWDKRSGMLYLYFTSPAPLTALLIGMSLGGILGTLPSSIFVLIIGTLLFNPPFSPPTISLLLTFILTLTALYGMGISLASLYLILGREAEEINDALFEPVSFLSGVYFPSIGRGSPLPLALQAIASLIPLTLGMDALRRAVFYAESIAELWPNLAALFIMTLAAIIVGVKALSYIETIGRKTGDILVTLK
ncbi:MAG: ABC transporter permease [Nitrososphaerota archaeon]